MPQKLSEKTLVTLAVVNIATGYDSYEGQGHYFVVQDPNGTNRFRVTSSSVQIFLPSLLDNDGNKFVTSTSSNCTTCFAISSNLSESTNTSTLRSNIGFTGSSPISISSTGTIYMFQSGIATNGWLSSVDWSTFNNKISTSTYNIGAQSCGGTNKVSAISATGTITCTIDQTGGGSPTSTVEYVNAQSASNSNDKGQEVRCTAGKVVMGGGGDINNNAVNLSDSYPSGTAAWYVFGNEEGSVSGNWTITAWAICL